MDSLIGVITISLLFVLLAALVYFLMKKNIFETKQKAESDQLHIRKR